VCVCVVAAMVVVVLVDRSREQPFNNVGICCLCALTP
jgi:hypothetical protein